MCNAFRNRQQKETLHPHDIPGLPWQVVGLSWGQLLPQGLRAVRVRDGNSKTLATRKPIWP